MYMGFAERPRLERGREKGADSRQNDHKGSGCATLLHENVQAKTDDLEEDAREENTVKPLHHRDLICHNY